LIFIYLFLKDSSHPPFIPLSNLEVVLSSWGSPSPLIPNAIPIGTFPQTMSNLISYMISCHTMFLIQVITNIPPQNNVITQQTPSGKIQFQLQLQPPRVNVKIVEPSNACTTQDVQLIEQLWESIFAAQNSLAIAPFVHLVNLPTVIAKQLLSLTQRPPADPTNLALPDDQKLELLLTIGTNPAIFHNPQNSKVSFWVSLRLLNYFFFFFFELTLVHLQVKVMRGNTRKAIPLVYHYAVNKLEIQSNDIKVPSESSMLPFTERILTLIGSLQL
jgi:hypothetical protein